MDLSSSNLKTFCNNLSKSDFSRINATQDVDGRVDIFYEILNNCIKLIPIKCICRNSTDKPWINNTIKILIIKRWTAYKKNKRIIYEHYKQKIKNEIAIAKTRQIQKETIKNPFKSIWNYINNISAKQSNDAYYQFSQLFSNDLEVANALVLAFTDSFNAVSSSFTDSSYAQHCDDNTMEFHSKMNISIDEISILLGN